MNVKPSPLAFIVFLLAGWIGPRQLIVIEYLKAENRMVRERFHQGLRNRLIEPQQTSVGTGALVCRHERLGGMLSFYYRTAA